MFSFISLTIAYYIRHEVAWHAGLETNNIPMLKLITLNKCDIDRLNISGPIKIPKVMMIKVRELYDAYDAFFKSEDKLYCQWTVGQGAYFVRDLDLVAQLIKQMQLQAQQCQPEQQQDGLGSVQLLLLRPLQHDVSHRLLRHVREERGDSMLKLSNCNSYQDQPPWFAKLTLYSKFHLLHYL